MVREQAGDGRPETRVKKAPVPVLPPVKARRIEISICVIDRELFALHVAYDTIRKQRNELRSQLAIIHVVYSVDLRHSNLPTEACEARNHRFLRTSR